MASVGFSTNRRPWSATELAPDVWFIERDWRNCNHFVAREPRVTLIDTGYGPDLGDTIAALEAVGVRPGDIELIVNTHCHCDHAGGNSALIAQSGAEVWMHVCEKERIDRLDAVGTWWGFHDTWADFFRVDRGLRDGASVPFGPLDLEVIYAPGHSTGQIMLYSDELKALFSSDALWQGDMGVINPFVEGDDALDQAARTLHRIARLDLKTVYPGHGPAIVNPQPALERALRKLNRFARIPDEMHYDHLCKMIAYIVLAKGGVREDGFFDYLKTTMWFPKLVDECFASAYREVFDEAMARVMRKRMLVSDGCCLRGMGMGMGRV